MMGSSTLDLLVTGAEFPLPALPTIHLEVISEAISSAWANLVASEPASSRDDSEPQITAWIEARLNHQIPNDPLLRNIVCGVVRGRESISVDGSRIEVRPDLSFILVGRNPNFPLHIECKVIHHVRNQTVNIYCKKGLSRFLDGTYSWWSREAMMVAFVRDSSTVLNELIPYMESKTDTHLIGSQSLNRDNIVCTIHHRFFNHFHTKDKARTIRIWHIWLTAASA